MRRITLVIAILVGTCNSGQSALVVDQEVQPVEGQEVQVVLIVGASGVFKGWAQTFRVGHSGQLAAVDVFIAREPSTVTPLQFDIRTVVGGVPSRGLPGSILASGLLDASAVPIVAYPYHDGPNANVNDGQMVRLDFSDFSVNQGDELAIMLQSVGGNYYYWFEGPPGSYPDGADLWLGPFGWMDDAYPQAAAGFRTYLEVVPEPNSTIALTTAALLVVGTRCRARRGLIAAKMSGRICA
jgi:hypothetical protein